MSRTFAAILVCTPVALIAPNQFVRAGEPTGACCYGLGSASSGCMDDATAAECNTFPAPRFWSEGIECLSACYPDDRCFHHPVCDDGDPCSVDACNFAIQQCIHDYDLDNDGVENCDDGCPNNPNLTTPPPCGCQTPPPDRDSDGRCDALDSCPDDATNTCVVQAPATSMWGMVVLIVGLLACVARKADLSAGSH